MSDRAGTIGLRRRTAAAPITRGVTRVRHGWPIPAVEAAGDRPAPTVRAGADAASVHSQAVQQAAGVPPRDRLPLHAAAIHGPTHAGGRWLARAMLVRTRRWRGGAVSAARDRDRLGRLVALVAAGARWGPLLVVTAGVRTASAGVRPAVRTRQTRRGARPRRVGWPDLVIAQGVTQAAGRAVSGTSHRLVHGSVRRCVPWRWRRPHGPVLNTACSARLTGTVRSRLAVLGRRTRWAARRALTVTRGMDVVGTLDSLWCVQRRRSTAAGRRQTPAMAAGITDHVWPVGDRLRRRVPAPRWAPPRRRGRRSRARQARIDRWCPHHRLA